MTVRQYLTLPVQGSKKLKKAYHIEYGEKVKVTPIIGKDNGRLIYGEKISEKSQEYFKIEKWLNRGLNEDEGTFGLVSKKTLDSVLTDYSTLFLGLDGPLKKTSEIKNYEEFNGDGDFNEMHSSLG